MIGRIRASGEGGLSLVELVVVLSIGGLLLALAFNGQGLLANRRLVGAARNLASDVRMLEQRSRAERTCYRIVFDPAAETYTIDKYVGAVTRAPAGGGNQCTDAAAWQTAVIKDDPADTVSRRMPRGVEITTTTFAQDTLVFSPTGNPNAGRATLQTPSGQWRQVEVEVTGRVRILP
ncbi:MAG: hypothetical protein QN168_00745 [Armatimonadota bacterium]|nr:hypothetical protein [Armatimonadota bacterium]